MILGWEDPLEKEMATHSSILAQRFPWTEEPGGAAVHGLQRVRHNQATNTTTDYMLTVNPRYITTVTKYLVKRMYY